MAKTNRNYKAVCASLVSVHTYISRNSKRSGSASSSTSETSPRILERMLVRRLNTHALEQTHEIWSLLFTTSASTGELKHYAHLFEDIKA